MGPVLTILFEVSQRGMTAIKNITGPEPPVRLRFWPYQFLISENYGW